MKCIKGDKLQYFIEKKIKYFASMCEIKTGIKIKSCKGKAVEKKKNGRDLKI